MYCYFLLTGVFGFLEFGNNRKFVTNRGSSDAASEPIPLPSGFPFGSEIHTLAFVSVYMGLSLVSCYMDKKRITFIAKSRYIVSIAVTI